MDKEKKKREYKKYNFLFRLQIFSTLLVSLKNKKQKETLWGVGE